MAVAVAMETLSFAIDLFLWLYLLLLCSFHLLLFYRLLFFSEDYFLEEVRSIARTEPLELFIESSAVTSIFINSAKEF